MGNLNKMISIPCIILAGGFGTRLRGVVPDIPKCLAPISGNPFLYWQLLMLKSQGISRFIVSLGFESNKVISELQDWGADIGPIEFLVEDTPLGTGGAILNSMKHLGLAEVIVINGDTLLRGDLSPLFYPLDVSAGELMRVGVVYVGDRARYGGVELNRDGSIAGFGEKGSAGAGLINAGIYRISINAFPKDLPESFSLETNLLKQLVKSKNLNGSRLNVSFIDIGVPDDYFLLGKSNGDWII